jgi:AmpD protein
MYLIEPSGWLANAIKHPSTNYNQRPDCADISLLVIHSNRLDCDAHPSFDDLRGLNVSAHVFIDRNGAVYQFVSFNDRAWHAGVSQFDGRDNCNDFSIGVELEGVDDIGYTQAQYRELIAVTESVQSYYPAITTARIVGHCEIAPGRKTDPGSAFDWASYKNALG